MRNTMHFLIYSTPLLLGLIPGIVFAEPFEEFKQNISNQAIQNGIPESFVTPLMNKMVHLDHVVQADRKQPEFHTTFWDYTDKRITQKRIETGKKLYQKHKKLLDELSAKYGVPPQYILAFWGLETNYGNYTGKTSLISALGTMAYDKRRKTFFTKQLLAYMNILYQNQSDDFDGSWAGAFGQFQFMPTTFEAYAVDGDHDGKFDILNSLPDAFESAANYLNKIGWKRGERWGREIVFTKEPNLDVILSHQKMPIKQWAEQGLAPADGSTWNDMDIMAELVMPMGIYGPLFLTYPNFNVIMKWNKSHAYALTVGLLADQISGQGTGILAPRTDAPFSYAQAKELQNLLKKRGFYQGPVDGNIGAKTRKSIRLYQKSIGLPTDGFANTELLERMKKDK